MHRLIATAFVLAAFAAGALPARAIVIRADRPDAAYLAEGARFPQVGWLMDQVGCTLVAPRWVLGAAHSVEGLSPFSDRYVQFGGVRYPIVKIVIPPARVADAVDSSADLALIELATPVAGVMPVPLYAKDDEVDQTITIAGRGRSGRPDDATLADDGKLRAGTERVAAAIGTSLFAVFHQPPEASPLEAAGAAGDSGGPAFVTTAAGYALAGVSSFASTSRRDGAPHRYQTLQGYARVSSWRKWILDTIAADPPSSVAMFDPLRPAVDLLPQTPAARALADFVAAFNTPSLDPMAAFYRDHGSAKSTRTLAERANQWNQERATWGKLTIRAFTASGPQQFAVAAYAERSAGWVGIWFVMDPADPTRLSSITTGGIPKPELP